MASKQIPLTDETIELVARRFRLLGEPVRLRLLQLLESDERTVNELVAALQGNQPNISRHLNALFDGGLVKRRRDGINILYSIADPVVFKLCGLVCASAREQVRGQLSAFDSQI